MQRIACLIMLVPLAATAACAGDAAGEPPALAVPAQFHGPGTQTATVDTAQWWRRFQDPVLDRLVEQAVAANPEVLQAVARIRQARAQQTIVGAAGLPSVDATGQAGYTRISENAIPPLPGTGTGEPSFGLPGMDFTTFRAGFDASWEADLFGGRKYEKQSAAERAAAAIWQKRDIEVSVAAEIGKTYLDYRALQQRSAIAGQRLASERELLELAEARFRNGLTSSDRVRRQEQRLADAAAAAAAVEAERMLRVHALGTLLGQPPSALEEALAPPAGFPASGFEVPPGLPSELLLRRPDLRAADRQLAAALSDVGTARAALFPKISLTGALHLVSTSLANLLAPGSLQVNAAAGISLPILDGGRRRATIALRQAQAAEQAEGYRGHALAAFREVEDALTSLESARAQEAEREAAAAAARDVAATAGVRYRNRLVALAELIEARQAQLVAEDALAEARAATATRLVGLYKALGGGWTLDGGYDG